VPEPSLAQRIVRAKRTLAEAHVRFEVPRGAELSARLANVLQVIYLIFNEGYSARRVRLDARTREDALRLAASSPSLRPMSRKSTAWWVDEYSSQPHARPR